MLVGLIMNIVLTSERSAASGPLGAPPACNIKPLRSRASATGRTSTNCITIATLIGKIGWDERTRRKNGRNGNGASVARLVKVVDDGFKEARESRRELYRRVTENGKAIATLQGRLDK